MITKMEFGFHWVKAGYEYQYCSKISKKSQSLCAFQWNIINRCSLTTYKCAYTPISWVSGLRLPVALQPQTLAIPTLKDSTLPDQFDPWPTSSGDSPQKYPKVKWGPSTKPTLALTYGFAEWDLKKKKTRSTSIFHHIPTTIIETCWIILGHPMASPILT